MKLVSKVSFGGIAPLRPPALSRGTVKQFALSAGPFTPLNPVYACLGEQPAGERRDWIGDVVVHAIEDTSDRTRKVHHAVGLTALDYGDALNGPAIYQPSH